MDSIIKNPGDSIRGIRLTGGARPIEILVRFTKENIGKIFKTEISEKQFTTWLTHEVHPALDEPVEKKENFATMEVDEKVVKPPLGIVPEWLWKEARMAELRQAMKRRLAEFPIVTMMKNQPRQYPTSAFVEHLVACFSDETLMRWVKEYVKLEGEMEVINLEKKLNI